ncbi:MAG: hypothetical protein WBD55_00260 [Dehalococcoidia bacterium]
MLQLTVDLTASEILRDCAKRGLVVKLETIERGRQGARHWHLGFPDMPGVLEITDLGDTTLLKVADNRDGGWAKALARELARNAPHS